MKSRFVLLFVIKHTSKITIRYFSSGAIPKDDGKANPLDEMSEQEKEEEAEKLALLIRDLNRRGVIRTAQVGLDGRPLTENEDTASSDTTTD